MANKSVLMLCYYFPPFARSGGMRSLQFGRRLQALGWDVEVLAADPAPVLVVDRSGVDREGLRALTWAKVTHVGLPPEQRAVAVIRASASSWRRCAIRGASKER
jgi:hypothetical protein